MQKNGIDEPVLTSSDGPDRTSIKEPRVGAFAVEKPPTETFQFLAAVSIEDQQKPPTTYSFPTDCPPFYHVPISLDTALGLQY